MAFYLPLVSLSLGGTEGKQAHSTTRAHPPTVMRVDFDIAILSLFCAGGLFAYIREVLRLQRLIASGETAVATIVDTREDSAGSESVTHYLVKYEFTDSDGHRSVHEQDLNSKRFFDTLKPGDTIDVLYDPDSNGSSYPLRQINSDIKISRFIAVAITIFWAVMAAFFALK